MVLDWERPPLIAAIDKMIGNKKDYLKFAYFIFSKTPQAATDKNLYRVVSSHLNSAGKSELLICGEEKIRRLVSLDKDKKVGPTTFDVLQRGDLIRYDGPDRINSRFRKHIDKI